MAVGSFSAGLSGLNANAQALSVVGNNLANVTLLRERRLSVFYLGTGQRVPDDLRRATAERLSDSVVRDEVTAARIPS